MDKEQLLKDYRLAIDTGDTELEDAIVLKLDKLNEAGQPKIDSGNLNNPDFYWNSARKGLTGMVDAFAGAPEVLGGVLSEGAKYYAGELGFTPKHELQPVEWPRRAHDVAVNAGLIKPELGPSTGGERLIDAGVQLASGGFIMPGNALKNAAVGGISGMIGEGVHQATDSPLAGLLATLATPLVAPVVKAGVHGVRDSFNTKLTNAGRQNLAGERLVQVGGGDRTGLLHKLKNYRLFVEGSEPTTAQAVMDPGFASMQRTFEAMPGPIATAPGEQIRNIVTAFAERAAEQRKAQVDALNKIIPEQNGAPKFQQGVRTEVENINRGLQTPADLLIQRMGQTVDEQIGGGQVRDIFNRHHQSAKSSTSNLFESVDPGKTTQIPVPLSKIQGIVDKYYAVAPDLVPSEIKALLAAAERLAYPNGRFLQTKNGQIPLAPSPATYAELQALASNASSISHEAGKAFKNQLSSSSRQIKQELRDAIKVNLADQTYHNALVSRAKQGDVFETGASRKMIKTGSNEAPLLEDANVLKNFLNGSPDDVSRFLKSMQNDPQAATIAQNYMATNLRQKIYTPSGELKGKWRDEWARFVTDHKPVIDQFPALKKRIDDAYLAQEAASRTASKLETGGARFFTAEKDPEKSLSMFLNSPNKQQDIKDILQLMPGDAQKQNLAGGIKDQLLGDTTQRGASDILGNSVFNRGKALEFMNDPANIPLSGLLNKRQQVGIRNVKRDFERTDYLNYSPRARGSDTNANLANRSFIGGAGKVADYSLNKVLGPIYGLLKSGYQGATRDAAQQLDGLIARGLLDPKEAIKLIESLPPESRKIVTNYIAKNSAKLSLLPTLYGINTQEETK